MNNLELAVNLPKRGYLPGAENLVVQHFLELFAQTKHTEVAELAVESPQGILRTPDTVDKFQVPECHLVIDPHSKESCRFAFVAMETNEEANLKDD